MLSLLQNRGLAILQKSHMSFDPVSKTPVSVGIGICFQAILNALIASG